MRLIKADWWFGGDSDDGITASYDQDEHGKIRELLLGRKVEKVADDHLLLDDGTLVKVVPNSGCGGCNSGWYDIETINGTDNIITRVDFRQGEIEDDGSRYDTYEVFVFTGHKEINLLTVAGDDGNGYYGTGYELLIRAPEEER